MTVSCRFWWLCLAGALLPFTLACDPVAGEQAPQAAGRQFIVAVDLSGSRTPRALSDSEQVVRAIAELMQPDDQFVLIRIEARGRQAGNAKIFDAPHVNDRSRLTSSQQEELQDIRDDVKNAAKRLFGDATSVDRGATDILSTLFVVTDHIRSPRRAAHVILLSDMLQDTGDINLERGIVPTQVWVSQAKARNRLPDLTDVCVSAVGADPSTDRGIQVRSFWDHFFGAAQARFDPARYRQVVPDAQNLLCD